MQFIVQILSLIIYVQCFGQNSNFNNNYIIQQLYKDEGYILLKRANEFAKAKSGKWGEFVKVVDEKLVVEDRITVSSFDILYGDVKPSVPINTIKENVLSRIRPGAMIIMHFNHPKWNIYESLLQIISRLRTTRYTLAKIENFPE